MDWTLITVGFTSRLPPVPLVSNTWLSHTNTYARACTHTHLEHERNSYLGTHTQTQTHTHTHTHSECARSVVLAQPCHALEGMCACYMLTLHSRLRTLLLLLTCWSFPHRGFRIAGSAQAYVHRRCSSALSRMSAFSHYRQHSNGVHDSIRHPHTAACTI